MTILSFGFGSDTACKTLTAGKLILEGLQEIFIHHATTTM